jgi:hypothetical protein
MSTNDRRDFLRRLSGLLAAVAGGSAVASVTAPGEVMARAPEGVERIPAGAEDWIGQVVQVPYNFAPRGFVFCEGQELSIQQNQALYSLIGNFYGGDGRTSFKLPDTRLLEESLKKTLRAPRPPFRYAIALAGTFPSRA